MIILILKFTFQDSIKLSYHMKGGDEGVVGNIEKRGENSYRLRVSAGYTDEGKRIMYKKTVQAKNKSEARN